MRITLNICQRAGQRAKIWASSLRRRCLIVAVWPWGRPCTQRSVDGYGEGCRSYNAVSSSLVECSLNFLMSGRTARCFPACIVTSFSLPVCKYMSTTTSQKRDKMHLIMVHKRRTQVDEAINTLFPQFPRLELCAKRYSVAL